MKKIITILLATALGVIACAANQAMDTVVTDSINTVESIVPQVQNNIEFNMLISGLLAATCFFMLISMVLVLSFNNTYKSTSFWPEIKTHSKISAYLVLISTVLSLITLLLI